MWRVIAVFLTILGCSAADEVGGRRLPPGQSNATPCTDKVTELCTCDNGLRGARTCEAGSFTACECRPGQVSYVDAGDVMGDDNLSALAGNARSDIMFDWERTEPDGLTCEPGHYEGSFAGLYYSRLNWPIAFPVIGVDLPGFPGLQFDMEPSEPGEVTLKVNGKFDGLADGLFPFRGDFVGELDCKSGKFTGMMLNGDYSIGPREIIIIQNPIHFAFEGPVTADYDKLTHSFINGTWDAFESVFGGIPAVTLPRDSFRDGVGGSGVWSTGWIGEPVDYKCPPTDAAGLPLACQPGPFGLTKTFCVYPALLPGARADGPICQTDQQCEASFPGEAVKCVDVNGDGAYVRCLKECAP